jgi:hypothetical protein
MKIQFDISISDKNQRPSKQEYQAPVLQHFGAVTDLTNNTVGSCRDDGNNCPRAPGTMGRKP